MPHLCQFAPTKRVLAPEDDISSGITKYVPALPTSSIFQVCATDLGPACRLSRKRKEESFESDSSPLAVDPDQGLSDGLAKLGYMTGHDFFNLAKPGADVSYATARPIVNCLTPHKSPTTIVDRILWLSSPRKLRPR